MDELILITVDEYKGRSDILIKSHADMYFRVEYKQIETDCELWGFLCDAQGYNYVYSLCIESTRYADGYLKRRGDWHACFGGGGYNKLVVKEAELIRALTLLGYGAAVND